MVAIGAARQRRRAPVPDLAGRACLITGAASGIGRATALAAARRGAELLLTDLQAEPLHGTAELARAAGARDVRCWAADVSDHDAVLAMARDVHDARPCVDVVMNIAGISIWGPVEQLEHEHWRRQVEVNLMGPISVIEAFIPPMIRAGRRGQLVNVSSSAGLFGLPWHAAYSASKFGLRGVSEVLRFDLRRHGIGVTLVCPGAVDTPLVDTVGIVGVDRTAPDVRELVARFRRHAVSPEHVAEAIIAAVEHNRFLVLTSPDIQLGYWFQRKFALPYELAMRLLNDRLVAVALASREGSAPPAAAPIPGGAGGATAPAARGEAHDA